MEAVRPRALDNLITRLLTACRRHRQMDLTGTARDWSRDKCARPPASTSRRSLEGPGSAPRCGRGAWREGFAPILRAVRVRGDATASSTCSVEKEMMHVEIFCRRDPWPGLCSVSYYFAPPPRSHRERTSVHCRSNTIGKPVSYKSPGNPWGVHFSTFGARTFSAREPTRMSGRSCDNGTTGFSNRLTFFFLRDRCPETSSGPWFSGHTRKLFAGH